MNIRKAPITVLSSDSLSPDASGSLGISTPLHLESLHPAAHTFHVLLSDLFLLHSEPRSIPSRLWLCFFITRFMEIWFTYQTIKPFDMDHSLVFSIFKDLCNHHQSILEYLYHFKKRKRKRSFSSHSLIPPKSSCPPQPIIYFLSLYIYLLWIFHMNGIIQ